MGRWLFGKCVSRWSVGQWSADLIKPDMVDQCAAPKCQTGYTSSTPKVSSFHFPLKNLELNKKWIRFVCRSDWVPTKHWVLCELHFYKIKGKRLSLNWSMKPVPTIHSVELIDTPSVLPTTQTFRQPPRKGFSRRINKALRIHDKINSLDGLNQFHSPPWVWISTVGSLCNIL